jgi:hypothetical protein
MILRRRRPSAQRLSRNSSRIGLAHGYEKTEQSYDRLIEYLNRARRARMIPMDAIRDDGGAIHKPVSYRSAGEFLATVRWRAERFRLDRTAGQEFVRPPAWYRSFPASPTPMA